ncbi:MAG: hypothetical protein J6Y20_10120 [Lachnospiraceae bacterium]|nr:hypothetical protein [Lachnospiraceae bacterium]MBP5462469.1 hypothetical protein [Lachnospiraceae bacterium]
MKTKVDEKMFRTVKLMTAGGATIPELIEYTGLAKVTISRIRRAETLEQMREEINASSRVAPKVEAPKPVAQPQSYMPYATQMELIKLLKEQSETLKLISNKLVFIVEQLA